MTDFGVLYMVDENPHFQRMLDVSVQSLRRHHPNWPIEVTRVASPTLALWRRLYRRATFWKRHKRRARGFQDTRTIARKARAMLETPFRHTLFLDADTVVMNPLDELRRRAEHADILVTPNPWKTYRGLEAWHPPSFPYVNSGVVFYGDRFVHQYRRYVERLGPSIGSLPTFDQYIVSLVCTLEADRLRIVLEPALQIDVLNLEHHLGTRDYPRANGILDLAFEGLAGFHVFHYNEDKDRYLEAIAQIWGLEPTLGAG